MISVPDVQLDERAYWTESRVFYDGYPPPDYVLANYTQYEDVRQLFDYTGLNFNFFARSLEESRCVRIHDDAALGL